MNGLKGLGLRASTPSIPRELHAGLDDQGLHLGHRRGHRDWIIEGLAGLAAALWDAIKDALPSPGDIKDAIVGSPATSVAGDHQRLRAGAEGGVFNQATPMIIGEAGTEALIPITRPAASGADATDRTRQDGLNALPGAPTPSDCPGNAVVGETTMLHIDTAVMTAPVDADMIVQKITAAYNRLAIMSYPPRLA